jgi:hypothetical protein
VLREERVSAREALGPAAGGCGRGVHRGELGEDAVDGDELPVERAPLARQACGAHGRAAVARGVELRGGRLRLSPRRQRRGANEIDEIDGGERAPRRVVEGETDEDGRPAAHPRARRTRID